MYEGTLRLANKHRPHLSIVCNYHSKVRSEQAQDFLQDLQNFFAYRLPTCVQA